jgi:hypothetical protein
MTIKGGKTMYIILQLIEPVVPCTVIIELYATSPVAPKIYDPGCCIKAIREVVYSTNLASSVSAENSERPTTVGVNPQDTTVSYVLAKLRRRIFSCRSLAFRLVSNDGIDEDEKYFEIASMTDGRKERIL